MHVIKACIDNRERLLPGNIPPRMFRLEKINFRIHPLNNMSSLQKVVYPKQVGGGVVHTYALPCFYFAVLA